MRVKLMWLVALAGLVLTLALPAWSEGLDGLAGPGVEAPAARPAKPVKPPRPTQSRTTEEVPASPRPIPPPSTFTESKKPLHIDFALSIGIAQYTDIKIGDLRVADSDALMLSSVFAKYGRIKKECLVSLFNRNATANNIRESLSHIIRHCVDEGGGAGLGIIYFSGRIAEKKVFGEISAGSLVPHDADPGRVIMGQHGIRQNATLISKEEFARLVNKVQSRYLILIEGCSAGVRGCVVRIESNPNGMIVSSTDNYEETSIYNQDSIAEKFNSGMLFPWINSGHIENFKCKYDEISLKHGLLSYVIINGFSGFIGTPDENGRIAFDVTRFIQDLHRTMQNAHLAECASLQRLPLRRANP